MISAYFDASFVNTSTLNVNTVNSLYVYTINTSFFFTITLNIYTEPSQYSHSEESIHKAFTKPSQSLHGQTLAWVGN